MQFEGAKCQLPPFPTLISEHVCPNQSLPKSQLLPHPSSAEANQSAVGVADDGIRPCDSHRQNPSISAPPPSSTPSPPPLQCSPQKSTPIVPTTSPVTKAEPPPKPSSPAPPPCFTPPLPLLLPLLLPPSEPWELPWLKGQEREEHQELLEFTLIPIKLLKVKQLGSQTS